MALFFYPNLSQFARGIKYLPIDGIDFPWYYRRMGQSLTVRLSWPALILWPNRKNGRNYTASSAAKLAQYKEGCYATYEALGDARPEITSLIKVTYHFHTEGKKDFDLDGALGALKGAQDGIAYALGIDDSQFRPMLLQDVIESSGKRFVTVYLEWEE